MDSFNDAVYKIDLIRAGDTPEEKKETYIFPGS